MDKWESPSPDGQQKQQQQDQERLLQNHLGWSDRQRRILSADGRAAELYSPTRGFAFEESELPLFHIARNDTRSVFDNWRKTNGVGAADGDDKGRRTSKMDIVGAWFRTLFMGESDFTSHHDELVYNVQTRTLFVDLRISRSRKQVFGEHRYLQVSSLDDLRDGDELRWYARQHVFAGYSLLSSNDKRSGMAGCCVRHHCLDWNYVGTQRPVPNKWWIEIVDSQQHRYPRLWKEWAFATNDVGHPYYGEVWERLPDIAPSNDEKITDTSDDFSDDDASAQVVMALRKKRVASTDRADDDGVVVVVGDHFNYCVGRPLVEPPKKISADGVPASSLVDLVDAAVAENDFTTARAWLGRLRGGHGRISSGWNIDLATDFWNEGKPFWDPKCVTVVGESIDACILRHEQDEWEVFECSLTSVDALKSFLVSVCGDEQHSPSKRRRMEDEESKTT